MLALAVYIGMMLGITMGYHRYYAHRMYTCPAWLEYLLLFFATIAFVGKGTEWVAQHRQHHEHSDTEKDPHSPVYKGFFYSYCLQFMSPIDKKYLVFDRLLKFQHRHYFKIIILYVLALIPFDLFFEAWLIPMLLVHLIGGLVYSFSHRNGKPNNDTWLGILTCGEGFHAVHHTEQKIRWHRYDLGGYLIEKIL